MEENYNLSEKKELSEAFFNRALNLLKQAEDNLNIGNYDTVINRCYYSAFYAVKSILLFYGVETATHGGTIIMFDLYVVKDKKEEMKKYSKILRELEESRETSDYDAFAWSYYSEDNAKYYLKITEEFLTKIDELRKEFR